MAKRMRIVIPVAILAIVLFFAFAYFHSKSIDRAQFVNAAANLLTAHREFRDTGSLTNQRRVSVWTNEITIGVEVFQGTFIADSPALSNHGSLVIAADQTLIWLDKKTGPVVVRGKEGTLVTPKRFHDF